MKKHPLAGNKEIFDCGLPEVPLEVVKGRKIQDLYTYDSSDAVNSFTLGGEPMWLSREDRAALKMRLEAEEASGQLETCIWHAGGCFQTTVAQAKAMLIALELYARSCYDNTQRHALTISALETKAAVDAYDFTVGYPSKIAL